MPERAFVVAIDGPAASGKGTLARALAQASGLRHLNSGVLYRATALRLLDAGGTPEDTAAAAAAAHAVVDADLEDPRLRNAAVARPLRRWPRSPRSAPCCWSASGPSPPRRLAP